STNWKQPNCADAAAASKRATFPPLLNWSARRCPSTPCWLEVGTPQLCHRGLGHVTPICCHFDRSGEISNYFRGPDSRPEEVVRDVSTSLDMTKEQMWEGPRCRDPS